MSQKNTLLVVGLVALFTASINAAEKKVTASDVKTRSFTLVQEIKAVTANLSNGTVDMETAMQQLEALQKEQKALNKALTNLLK
ncbi:MAG: hypothetical protein EBU90_15485 [Proteobacteria bacterium]|nr:hypothetical protein [Pseudomonadota bacterium]NBP13877.1 hypothetical protein [bacterium]